MITACKYILNEGRAKGQIAKLVGPVVHSLLWLLGAVNHAYKSEKKEHIFKLFTRE